MGLRKEKEIKKTEKKGMEQIEKKAPKKGKGKGQGKDKAPTTNPPQTETQTVKKGKKGEGKGKKDAGKVGEKLECEFTSKKFGIHEKVEMKIPPLLSPQMIQKLRGKSKGRMLWERGRSFTNIF
jgi:hypothetical protein